MNAGKVRAAGQALNLNAVWPRFNSLATGGPVDPAGGLMQAFFSMGSAFYENAATAPHRRIQAGLAGPTNGIAGANFAAPYDVVLSGSTATPPQATSASITLALDSKDNSGPAPYGQWGYLPANSSAVLAYLYQPK